MAVGGFGLIAIGSISPGVPAAIDAFAWTSPAGRFTRPLGYRYDPGYHKERHSMPDIDDDLNLASGISAFEAKHFARAMQLLTPIAEEGNAEAQYRLAIMYQNGLGTVRNELKAFKWMEAAAEQGMALAQHGFGFMYMEGDCVEQNGERAVYWFTQAAEQGLAGSQTTLAMLYEEGRIVPKDAAAARHWYRKAGFDSEA